MFSGNSFSEVAFGEQQLSDINDATGVLTGQGSAVAGTALRFTPIHLRPDGNITQSGWTGGYAEIDEVTPNDTDFAYSTDGTTSDTLEVSLTNPGGSPTGAGTATILWRWSKMLAGVSNGSGSGNAYTLSVYQGTTLIDEVFKTMPFSGWCDASFTPDLSSVTDWDDLRIRIVTAGIGTNGVGISWLELQVPELANVEHPTSGALVGQGAVIDGSAARTRDHATTGVLTGQGSTVTGSAARTKAHAATGVLTGQGSEVTGSAARTTDHATTGTLTGQGSTVAGTAARTRAHDTTGAITGPGSVIDGAAARASSALEHPTSGALVGSGSVVSGTATLNKTHTTTGDLIGQGSIVVGSAARLRDHATTGILTGQGASVSGTATLNKTHDTTGALVGQGSVITGTASLPAALTTSKGGDDAPRGIYYQDQPKRKKRKTIDDMLDRAIDEYYADIKQADNKDIIEQAEKIVKPYRVPKQDAIDWDKFMRNAKRVQKLIDLYEKLEDYLNFQRQQAIVAEINARQQSENMALLLLMM